MTTTILARFTPSGTVHPIFVIRADRAKTRSEAPYSRAESEFLRFFLLCAVVGRENRAALNVSQSFRTVCVIFAPPAMTARVELTRSELAQGTVGHGAFLPLPGPTTNARFGSTPVDRPLAGGRRRRQLRGLQNVIGEQLRSLFGFTANRGVENSPVLFGGLRARKGLGLERRRPR